MAGGAAVDTSVYPDGAASRRTSPIQDLNPSPAFEKVIESCGGVGEKVEAPEDLTPALKRSFEALRSGTPALLNVSVQPIR